MPTTQDILAAAGTKTQETEFFNPIPPGYQRGRHKFVAFTAWEIYLATPAKEVTNRDPNSEASWAAARWDLWIASCQISAQAAPDGGLSLPTKEKKTARGRKVPPPARQAPRGRLPRRACALRSRRFTRRSSRSSGACSS